MTVQVAMTFVDEQAKNGDLEAQRLLMPTQATHLAAGYDLVAANQEPLVLQVGKRMMVPTGIAIALPEGYEAQVRPRSGLAAKNGITVLNSPGTIDADYRGEIKVILINLGDEDFVITRGMRVAQLVMHQVASVNFAQMPELPATVRGEKGFGSSGTTKTI